MAFFRRALAGLCLLAATLGFLTLAVQMLRDAAALRMAEPAAAPGVPEASISANVIDVVAGPAAPTITAYGEVRARTVLELRSAQGGTVVDLAAGFEDGASVRAGQFLLRVDPAYATSARDLARADLAEAEAEARQAGAALVLARDDLAAARTQEGLRTQALERQEDLRDRGAGSDASAETAALALSAAGQAVLSRRSALAGAEAQVEATVIAADRRRIALAEAERALAETELRAPFAGVLDGVSVQRGRLLSANERIGVLVDPAALEVAGRVSTAQYARLLEAGDSLTERPVSVSLDADGLRIVTTGRLTRAAAGVGDGLTGRQVFVTLDRPAGFRPGDFVTLRIAELPLADAVVLPATALGSDGAVLALGDGDRLEALPATLLRRDGDRVILSGAGLDGRRVVAARSPLLGAGIKVRPVLPGATAPEEAAASDLIDLSPERRARLVAQVTADTAMPPEAKARALAQLAGDRVPARMVERLEARGGG